MSLADPQFPIPLRCPFFNPLHGPFSLTPIWQEWLEFLYPFVPCAIIIWVWFLLLFALLMGPAMDLSITNAPPSTPTNLDAIVQISEGVEILCSSMGTGRQVMGSTFMRLRPHTDILHRRQKHFRVSAVDYVPNSAKDHGFSFVFSPRRCCRVSA
jgi:hypothetical protein